MTSATPTATPHSRTRLLPLAVGASVAQMLMLIPGYSDAGSFQTGARVSVRRLAASRSVAPSWRCALVMGLSDWSYGE